MPQQRVLVVDAFAEAPFSGNPAAVCLLQAPWSVRTMQLVAREMNLSETAFAVAREAGGYELRWFTPTTEVDLCGHATLATAHVLWEEGHLRPDEAARFHTASGMLVARRRESEVTIDFPARPSVPCDLGAELAARIGRPVLETRRYRDDALVRLASTADVRAVVPDALDLEPLGLRAVVVTAAPAPGDAEADAAFDFVSRFFAPGVGILEDPVTGSAHCVLAPYWAGILGRPRLRAYQASARGGRVDCEIGADGDRVHLSGRAVTVLRGELEL